MGLSEELEIAFLSDVEEAERDGGLVRYEDGSFSESSSTVVTSLASSSESEDPPYWDPSSSLLELASESLPASIEFRFEVCLWCRDPEILREAGSSSKRFLFPVIMSPVEAGRSTETPPDIPLYTGFTAQILLR